MKDDEDNMRAATGQNVLLAKQTISRLNITVTIQNPPSVNTTTK